MAEETVSRAGVHLRVQLGISGALLATLEAEPCWTGATLKAALARSAPAGTHVLSLAVGAAVLEDDRPLEQQVEVSARAEEVLVDAVLGKAADPGTYRCQLTESGEDGCGVWTFRTIYILSILADSSFTLSRHVNMPHPKGYRNPRAEFRVRGRYIANMFLFDEDLPEASLLFAEDSGSVELTCGADAGSMQRQHGAATSEEQLACEAYRRDPSDLKACWTWGLWSHHTFRDTTVTGYSSSEQRPGPRGEALLREALAGGAPGALAAELAGREGRAVRVAKELGEFRAFCAGAPGLAGRPELREALPRIIEELRGLPEDVEWQVQWAKETVEVFGPGQEGAAYGETPFASFQAILSTESVAKALTAAKATPPSDGLGATSRPQVVVVGCALGYQCVFTLAMGAQCTGYDVLSDSMLARGREVVAKHVSNVPGIQMVEEDLFQDACKTCRGTTRFPLGSYRNCHACWVEGSRKNTGKKAPGWNAVFEKAALVWLNDRGWPLANVSKALRLAAMQLIVGAVVVSYGSEVGAAPAGLRLAETLAVPTSWSDAEEVRIFVKE